MSYSGKFKDKNNNLHPVTSVLYGTCDTAAATAAKVVTCSDFDTLMTGVTIRVKFANVNTAASPTVNINSTGAKSVYRFGSTDPVDGNSWNAGEVVELVYDGTSFFMTGADDIAAKQNATDNSLQTTDKTVVGAINEHEGDIGSLKSGLTNHENKNNVVIGWDNRNLWDEQGEQGIYNTETGKKGTGNNFRCKNYIPCEPETNYYMVKPNIGCYVLFYTSTKQFIRSISLNADAHVITTPENAKYITFYMFLAYGTTYNNDISFNADNTDTVYHKYHPVIGPAVEELQSGLTNVDVALSVPDGTGKNLMPMTLEGIKSTNTSGTWDGDNYTLNGITMAIQKDTNGNVIGLKFTGTSSSQSSTYFYAGNFTCKKGIGYRMNGCPAGGGGNTYLISISGSYPDTGSGSVIIPFNVDTPISARISVAAGYAFAADGVVFTPMIRYSWVDDSTFAPYIPSVDARLEAVEAIVSSYTLTPATGVTLDRGSCIRTINTVTIDAVVTFTASKGKNNSIVSGMPAIGNNNIPMIAVVYSNGTSTVRHVRLYNDAIMASEDFASGDTIHIMGTYTII